MHQAIAFRVALVAAGDRADAEEAVQDGFVKAYRALGRFREGAPFRPWLLRIVANEAHNRRRSAGRRAGLALRAAAAASGDAAPSPEAAVLSHERRDELLAALGSARRARPRRARPPVPARPRRGGDRGGARRPARHREVPHVARARPDAGGSRGGGVRERARARAPRARAARRLAGRARCRAARSPRGSPRRRARRRPSLRVGVALAVVLLALAVALAVPPARTAIFDWLGIGSARIELVDELPPLPLTASCRAARRSRRRSPTRAHGLAFPSRRRLRASLRPTRSASSTTAA